MGKKEGNKERKMKLQEAPSSISKVIKFPSSVTSYQTSEDVFDVEFYGFISIIMVTR